EAKALKPGITGLYTSGWVPVFLFFAAGAFIYWYLRRPSPPSVAAGNDQPIFRRILDEHPDPILLLDAKFRVTYANTAATPLGSGIPATDSITNVVDAHPSWEKITAAIESYDSEPIELKTEFEKTAFLVRITKSQDPSDTYTWKLLLRKPGGTSAKLHQKLYGKLREQQKLIQDIVDNVPMVVFVKDLKGRYRIVNNYMLKVLGLEKEMIMGKTDFQLQMDQERLFTYQDADDQVINQGKTITIEDTVEIEGNSHFFWVTKLPLKDAAGTVKYICGIASDVTAFKEVEAHLTLARDEAESAKAAQENFLANISHEIRTPMNGIIGMASLLSETKLDSTQSEYTESIKQAADSLLGLINDLLDVSKIRAGKFQLEHIEFNVREVITKVIYPLQFRAEEKGIALNLEFKNGMPAGIKGDPMRLQQILINLVNNAIKFTSEGEVKVSVDAERQGNTIILIADVSDTGIGIPIERQQQIFDIYSQSEQHTARLYGGTGLGLNIVKQLLELQSGTIALWSEPGKGSIFSFRIPYDLAFEKAVVIETEDTKVTEKIDGLRVLVADDNFMNQKVVQYVLDKWRADIVFANNGQEAVEAAEKGNFDIILMDMQMPVMDGFEAMDIIRNTLKLKTPIIAMTANALKGEAEKCINAGANAYISKPFDQQDLLSQISSLVHNMKVEGPAHHKTTDMQTDLVDFSYIEDLAGGKPDYMRQVLTIFMDNTYPAVDKLEELINQKADFDPISKQAHFLKSSVGIIKIRDMYETLKEIEILGKEQRDREEIERLLQIVLATFAEARPIIEAKMNA
ncbi:MAG: response regulator, partial [Sphingobacteriales bacterium]